MTVRGPIAEETYSRITTYTWCPPRVHMGPEAAIVGDASSTRKSGKKIGCTKKFEF